MPRNVVPEEILTDHPDRFRAMIVESSNPAHSMADSAACARRFESLELLVVIDVAMTETARLAHYVLPAASQFEKPEATFFNLEFPHNTFHLRHPLLEPLPGTLPEPEIWARLVRALGVVDDADLEPLREARRRRAGRLRAGVPRARSARIPRWRKVLPFVLYETLGPTLPDGLAGAAALWGLAQKAAMTYPDAVRRAGHADGNALFDAILDSRSGVTFTVHEYEDDFALIAHADHKIALEMPEMLDEIRAIGRRRRRADNAGVPDRAVGGRAPRLHRQRHLPRPGAGANATSTERCGSASRTRRRSGSSTAAGRASPPRPAARRRPSRSARRCCPDMPRCPTASGWTSSTTTDRRAVPGVAPNALTSTEWRDAYAGTPWHKHVPARIEAVKATVTA